LLLLGPKVTARSIVTSCRLFGSLISANVDLHPTDILYRDLFPVTPRTPNYPPA
jgi:hypothetical protein